MIDMLRVHNTEKYEVGMASANTTWQGPGNHLTSTQEHSQHAEESESPRARSPWLSCFGALLGGNTRTLPVSSTQDKGTNNASSCD